MLSRYCSVIYGRSGTLSIFFVHPNQLRRDSPSTTLALASGPNVDMEVLRGGPIPQVVTARGCCMMMSPASLFTFCILFRVAIESVSAGGITLKKYSNRMIESEKSTPLIFLSTIKWRQHRIFAHKFLIALILTFYSKT